MSSRGPISSSGIDIIGWFGLIIAETFGDKVSFLLTLISIILGKLILS